MALVLEGHTVVVTNSALAQRFPGGVAGYCKSAPNGTYRSDGTISGVSFMLMEDARAYIDGLMQYGFADPWATGSTEIAMVEQTNGCLTDSQWLRIDLTMVVDSEGRRIGVPIAWCGNENPTTFVAPPGWQPNTIESWTVEQFVQNYELVDVSEAGAGRVETYRHRETGRIVYIGRPAVDARKTRRARYSDLAAELAPLMSAPSSLDRQRAVASFLDRAAELVKDSSEQAAGPLLLHGITARLSHQWRVAEQSFRKVTELSPNLLEGWLELTRALSKLDRLDELESTARQATAVDPTSAAAYGNLASALLQLGRPEEAKMAVTRALDLDASDQLNQAILRQIKMTALTPQQGWRLLNRTR